MMDGEENPAHYSLSTMSMVLMWDYQLCLVCFFEAFQAEVKKMTIVGKYCAVHHSSFHLCTAILQSGTPYYFTNFTGANQRGLTDSMQVQIVVLLVTC